MIVRLTGWPRSVSYFALSWLLITGGTQCSHLTKFAPTSRRDRPATEKSDDSANPPVEETASDEHEYRVILRDDTPFFRWLRSGLKADAKPSQFLAEGTRVELLEERKEEKFSQIRLPTRKKGWVPTRLLGSWQPVAVETGMADASEQDSELPSPLVSPSVPLPSPEAPDAQSSGIPSDTPARFVDPSMIPEIFMEDPGVTAGPDA